MPAPPSLRRCLPLLLVLSAGLLAVLPGPRSPAQELAGIARQMTTPERLRLHPWWPRKSFETRDDHVGSAVCGECHGALLASQEATPMARTLARVGVGAGLPGIGAAGSFELGPYRYEIRAGAEGAGFSVTDGARSLTAPLAWVFGAGETGYTYLWERDGAFYESRFSHFLTLDRLAPTPGRLLGLPDSLEMALGHPLSEKEARGCFSCHATAMVVTEGLDARRLTPGITCEGCHGPGADHVALEKSGLDGAGAVFNPGRLGPDGLADFCGACHNTFWDVEVGPSTGLATVRSPGYRLAKSRCWGAGGDTRLACTACHDPHGPLAHEAAAYDGACRACHDPGAATAAATAAAHPRPPSCPVGTEECVTCHMPRYELPEVHVQSTDHWIRVVRPDERFPD